MPSIITPMGTFTRWEKEEDDDETVGVIIVVVVEEQGCDPKGSTEEVPISIPCTSNDEVRIWQQQQQQQQAPPL